MSIRIAVPAFREFGRFLQFCDELGHLPESDHYLFDFAAMNWVTPFEMLYLCNFLRRYREERYTARFQAINHQVNPYAAHMGFFKAFGLEYGKDPGEAAGSPTYLPIRFLEFEEITRRTYDLGKVEQEIIEDDALDISRVLARAHDGPMVDMLSFCFREILRNALEHSGAPRVSYCAQYWPLKQEVEVAILDDGIGISESLRRNPHLAISCDEDALHYSLLPGISGRAFKGRKRNPHNHWDNSGFGLYMTSRLCGAGGEFFLASGESGLLLHTGKKDSLKLCHKGTAIRLLLKTANLQPLSNILTNIRYEGEAIARELRLGGNLSASDASAMLSRDFKRIE